MNLAHVLMEEFDHCIVKHAEKSLESFFKNTLMKFYRSGVESTKIQYPVLVSTTANHSGETDNNELS